MTDRTSTPLRGGRVTRRRFASLAGLGAAGIGLAAAGCSSSSNNANQRAATVAGGSGAQPRSTAAPGAATTAAPGTPAIAARKGGVLKAGQTNDLNLGTGFPYVGIPANAIIQSAMQEAIVRYRDSLQPELVLVDRFEYSADRTRLTASLRPDAAFQNGAKVTPEDVFYGIDVLLDPAKYGLNGSFQLQLFARFITAKRKVDDRTMEFTFDKPRGNMTDFLAQLGVAQASSYKQLMNGQDVETTGPFFLKSWSPSQSYRLEQNTHWRPSAKDSGPYLDAVDVKLFADSDALGLAFESGDVEVVLGVPGSVAKRFKPRGQTRVASKVGLRYMGANVKNPVLADKRVRQALFLAFDRKRFVDEVGEGFGEVTVQPWPKTSPAFDPALEAPFYDPAKAKQLLSQAGFNQTRNLLIEYNTPRDDDLAPLVKANLEAIGVKVDLAPIEGNAYLAKFRNRDLKDLYISSHAFSDLTPVTNFQQTFPYQVPDAQGKGGNISYYEGADYLDLVAKLESLDPLSPEAKTQYTRFNAIWLDDPWMMPLQPGNRIDLVGPKLQGLNSYLVTPSQGVSFSALWKSA
jgi:peptide/nickel transport system substrate-binding protein